MPSAAGRMHTGGMARFPASSMRASDADRDVVLAELSQHFQAGRLDHAEFDERSSAALAARTFADLAALMTDLPDLSEPAPAPEPVFVPPAPPQPRPSAPPARSGGAGPLLAAAVLAVLIAGLATLPGLHGIVGLWWLVLVALIAGRRPRSRR